MSTSAPSAFNSAGIGAIVLLMTGCAAWPGYRVDRSADVATSQRGAVLDSDSAARLERLPPATESPNGPWGESPSGFSQPASFQMPVENVAGAESPIMADPVAMAERRTPSAWSRATRGTAEAFHQADEALAAGPRRLADWFRGEPSRAWSDWGRTRLRDGDIVFLQGRDNYAIGFIDIAKLTQDIQQGPFTHVAIVAIEDGEAVLYEANEPRTGRITFADAMRIPNIVAVGVKRPRPEFQNCVPAAVAYCRAAADHRIPFDKKLKLDNDRLYCCELVELAYRSAGLVLTEPVRWESLPGIDSHPAAIHTIMLLNGNRLTDYAILPGNEQLGLWSSPALELVLPITDRNQPPGE